jgi:hypothetical protein
MKIFSCNKHVRYVDTVQGRPWALTCQCIKKYQMLYINTITVYLHVQLQKCRSRSSLGIMITLKINTHFTQSPSKFHTPQKENYWLMYFKDITDTKFIRTLQYVLRAFSCHGNTKFHDSQLTGQKLQVVTHTHNTANDIQYTNKTITCIKSWHSMTRESLVISLKHSASDEKSLHWRIETWFLFISVRQTRKMILEPS